MNELTQQAQQIVQGLSRETTRVPPGAHGLSFGVPTIHSTRAEEQSSCAAGGHTSTWREQASQLSETLNLGPEQPLTKPQIAARSVLKKDLDPFSGQPQLYAKFLTSFIRSTERCGFNEEENRERLLKCLKGKPALLAQSTLTQGGSVDQVMQRLMNLYGNPAVMLASLRDVVQKMPRLCPNLSNLATFTGHVEEVDAGCRLCKWNSAGSEILMEVEKKLPEAISRSWLQQKISSELPCGLSEMCVFLNAEINNAILRHVDILADPPSRAAPARTCTTQLGSGDYECPSETSVPASVGCVCAINSVQSSGAAHPANPVCGVCQGNHRIQNCTQFARLPSAEKFTKLRALRLCFKCLRSYSYQHRCNLISCGVNGCPQRHLAVMHEAFDSRGTPAMVSATMQCGGAALFKMVPVTLRFGDKTVSTLAFFDEGSAVSIIDKKIVHDLGVDGPVAPLKLRWTNNQQHTERSSRRVNVQLECRDQTHNLKGLRTVANLDLPEQELKPNVIAEMFPTGSGPLPYKGKAHLLLGLPHAHLIASKVVRKSPSYLAAETELGWTVYGGHREQDTPASQFRVCHLAAVPSKLEQPSTSIVEWDTFGVLTVPPPNGGADESNTKEVRALVKNDTEKRMKTVVKKAAPRDENEEEGAADQEQHGPDETTIDNEEQSYQGRRKKDKKEPEKLMSDKAEPHNNMKSLDQLDEVQERTEVEKVVIDGKKVLTMDVCRGVHTTALCQIDVIKEAAMNGEESPQETMRMMREVDPEVQNRTFVTAQQDDVSACQVVSAKRRSSAWDLCEQRRLILEPTNGKRLRGDYWAGRRSNRKKIIPYLGSLVRKDRIWRRRMKPVKRNYKITIAIDDSKQFDKLTRVRNLNFDHQSKVTELPKWVPVYEQEEGASGEDALFENMRLVLSDSDGEQVVLAKMRCIFIRSGRGPLKNLGGGYGVVEL